MLKIHANIDTAAAHELLQRAPGELHDALERSTILSLARLEAAVVQGTPVAFGFLVNAIFSEPFQGGLGGEVAVHPPAEVYAAPVEEGTKRHFPPVDALKLWVKKRFGLTDEKEITSAAWAVARAISRRGTPARHMFQRAWEAERDNVGLIFEQEIDAALARL